MGENKWRKYVVFGVCALCMFSLAVIQKPSLVISPIVTVGVIQRDGSIASNPEPTKRCPSLAKSKFFLHSVILLNPRF